MDIKPPKKRRIKSAASLPDMKNSIRGNLNPRNINNDYLRERAAKAIDRAKIPFELPAIKESMASNSSSLKQLVLDNKLLIVYGISIFSVAFFLYLYRLAFLPKPTILDTVTALNAQSFTDLSADIVFGPQKFLDYLLLKLNIASALGLRLSSVLFSIGALVVFFFIIKRWLSVKIAVLATFIFATSTWTIMQTRNSDFMNSFFLVIPSLLIAGSYIKRKKESIWIFPIFFLISVLTYLPGFIWFLLFCGVAYCNNIKKLITSNDLRKNIILGLTYVLPLIPLIYFLAKNPDSFKLWLGLPSGWQFEPSAILDNIITLPSELFVSGIESPLLWLYGSPLVDAATGIMALAGFLFVLADKLHPMRRIALIGLLIIVLLLLFIAGNVYISLFLPLLYIFTAFGVYYLLDQWFSIFPRNPVARAIGYVLICLLILGVSAYHVSRYFIVWPRNDRVIEAFETVSSDTINNGSNNKFYLHEE